MKVEIGGLFEVGDQRPQTTDQRPEQRLGCRSGDACAAPIPKWVEGSSTQIHIQIRAADTEQRCQVQGKPLAVAARIARKSSFQAKDRQRRKGEENLVAGVKRHCDVKTPDKSKPS